MLFRYAAAIFRFFRCFLRHFSMPRRRRLSPDDAAEMPLILFSIDISLRLFSRLRFIISLRCFATPLRCYDCC